jgi:hypothetical protein
LYCGALACIIENVSSCFRAFKPPLVMPWALRFHFEKVLWAGFGQTPNEAFVVCLRWRRIA